MSSVIIDIECNRLNDPDKIWVICCKDVESGELTTFRRVTDDQEQTALFKTYAAKVDKWIGHNIIGYDVPVLRKLNCYDIPVDSITDTLIVSKLVNYSRPGGHSIEQYGEEFGIEKIDVGKAVAGHNPFFNQWSPELEVYCARDVDINCKIYNHYRDVIHGGSWASSIALEQRFQGIVNDLHNSGFAFDSSSATALLDKVAGELKDLDAKIAEAFPPREITIREFSPKATRFGTINKTTVPRVLHNRMHEYEIGKTYLHTRREPFNPASHKQLIEVLNEAKWQPEDKTQTHIDTYRAYGQLQRSGSAEALREVQEKLSKLQITGWKINETNLGTLPEDAPEGARLLAKRILLESRRRTLTEWLGLVESDGRIHGEFYGIGAWTHRMAHQKPNTANIPREFKEDRTPKLLGKEMRQLWCAPPKRLLVGVDAEGIQLRVFAHYINDEEFTDALVRGKKADKTDPHSLNQRILGNVCVSRQAAKRFIYALLLGAGMSKLSQILGCKDKETKEALNRLMERYTGFQRLKKQEIPKDATVGYFIGLDGRKVQIPGETRRDREHLCMSGYLQNGEAIIIKRAAVRIDEILGEYKEKGHWQFVDIVHDELQSEVRGSLDFAKRIARIKAEAIKYAGEYYNLRCPMAGSYWNDDHNEYTIGKDWYATH